MDPLGRRYFTDLRFEEIASLSDAHTKEYIAKMIISYISKMGLELNMKYHLHNK